MASVTLKGIYKKYAGGVTAVSDFNLDIEDKEFIILVGPSGCGKSTTPVSYTHLDVYKRQGAENGTAMKTCPDCNGTGQVRYQQRTPFGVISSQRACDKCQGKGKIIEKSCPKCAGRGSVSNTKKVEIQVPAGIDDGQTLSILSLIHI